jgi:hypothetical protein
LAIFYIPLQPLDLAPVRLNGLKYCKSQPISRGCVPDENKVMPSRHFAVAIGSYLSDETECWKLSHSVITREIGQCARWYRVGKSNVARPTGSEIRHQVQGIRRVPESALASIRVSAPVGDAAAVTEVPLF